MVIFEFHLLHDRFMSWYSFEGSSPQQCTPLNNATTNVERSRNNEENNGDSCVDSIGGKTRCNWRILNTYYIGHPVSR